MSSLSWKPPLALLAVGGLITMSLAGCKGNSTPAAAPIVNNAAASDAGGPDPADANVAGGTQAVSAGGSSQSQPTRVLGQHSSYAPEQQGEAYSPGQQAPAPIVRGNPEPAPDGGQGGGYDQGYNDGESAGQAIAQADQPPPPLPVYDQPAAPDPNDIWTPGYWGYGGSGYYWIPGVWVAAPYYGALWTPPYWGWYGNRYRFHHGYWGPHVGYYGGVNYGYGYVGVGYYGGFWRGHDFFYNRSVSRVGPSFTTVYERPVIINNVHYEAQPTNRVSYNGGRGGIVAQPRPFELAAMRESHTPAVASQVALRQQAATNRGNAFAENHGRPAQAAFARPPLENSSAPRPGAAGPAPGGQQGPAAGRAGFPVGPEQNGAGQPGRTISPQQQGVPQRQGIPQQQGVPQRQGIPQQPHAADQQRTLEQQRTQPGPQPTAPLQVTPGFGRPAVPPPPRTETTGQPATVAPQGNAGLQRRPASPGPQVAPAAPRTGATPSATPRTPAMTPAPQVETRPSPGFGRGNAPQGSPAPAPRAAPELGSHAAPTPVPHAAPAPAAPHAAPAAPHPEGGRPR